MYIFFLAINIIYSIIFYFFSEDSRWLWHDLRIESILFFIIGLVMFFYFSPLYFWKKKEEMPVISKIWISKDNIKKAFSWFQKISYIIAFSFFYLSLYWISYSLWWYQFPYFIFSINLILLILFSFSIKKNKQIINLLFRSNSIVSTIISSLFFISSLLRWDNISEFNLIALFNSLLSLISLYLIINFDNNLEKIKKNSFYIFFLTYLILFLYSYIETLFKINQLLLFSYLWFMIWVLYFEYFPMFPWLVNYAVLSRYFWIFLNYIINIISIIMLFIYWNYWHFIIILLWLSIFNYTAHFKYKNYISLEFTILSIITVYIKSFYKDIDWVFIYNILFSYWLPLLFIVYSFFYESRHEFDNYLINLSWLFFNFVSLSVYFIMVWDANILHISLILLLESALLFSSFVRLRK